MRCPTGSDFEVKTAHISDANVTTAKIADQKHIIDAKGARTRICVPRPGFPGHRAGRSACV